MDASLVICSLFLILSLSISTQTEDNIQEAEADSSQEGIEVAEAGNHPEPHIHQEQEETHHTPQVQEDILQLKDRLQEEQHHRHKESSQELEDRQALLLEDKLHLDRQVLEVVRR